MITTAAAAFSVQLIRSSRSANASGWSGNTSATTIDYIWRETMTRKQISKLKNSILMIVMLILYALASDSGYPAI